MKFLSFSQAVFPLFFYVNSLKLISGFKQSPLRFPSRPVLHRTKIATCLNSFSRLALDQAILPLFKQAVAVDAVVALILLQSPKTPLTKAGLLHATAFGIGLWTFLGPKGWLAGVLYFVLGSLVTKIKMKEKESRGIAEKRGGKRGPENVWGSAAAAMVCAALTYVKPAYSSALTVGFIASLATKLSDTFASEIGKAYGKNTYLITTLKMVPRGTEGAVSVEGTLAGVVGSAIMAAVGFPLGLLTSSKGFVACILAAFIATTAESFIGAIYQDKYPWLTNEFVNLINTIIGAGSAIAIMLIF
jgi:uncharacterized protein (TIGR00297 family)